MRTSAGRWAWVLAATFLLATVVVVLMAFNITTSAPQIGEDASLPDIIFANFASAREAWLQDMGASVLFALGFLAVAALGPILRALLDRSDPRTTRVAILFLVAGTIGILSQIIYIGGKEVATAPYYCDCDFLAAQLISRGTVLDVIVGIQAWMVDAFSFLFALGLLAVASLASARAWPPGFVRASQGLAVVGLASVVWNRLAVPLLVNADVHIDYPRIGLAILVVIAGVMTPIWAAILARTMARAESPEAGTP